MSKIEDIGSSIVSFITGGTSTTSTSSTDPFAVDSISSSTQAVPLVLSQNTSSPTLTPPIDLLDFQKICRDALNGLQDQVNFSDSQSMLLDVNMWLENAALAQLRKSMISLSQQENTVFTSQRTNAINFNNNAVDPFNSSLSGFNSATAAMNAAQTAFANNSITLAQYNADVAAWNSALPGRNATIQAAYNSYATAVGAYNNQVATNNAAITQLNTIRQSLGIKDLLPLQTPITLLPASTFLLPTLQPAVTAGVVVPPLVAATMPQVAPTSTKGSVTTSINVSPTTPAEQAFLNSIQTNLDAIDSGPGSAYDDYLNSVSDNVATMQQAVTDYQKGKITTAQYNAALTTYLNFVNNTANPQLSTLGQAYIDAINTYNGSGNVNINSLNVQIDAFNVIRLAANEQPIPDQIPLAAPDLSGLLLPTNLLPGPPPPAIDPFSTSPSILLSPTPVGSVTPTSSKTYIAKYFAPIYAAFVTALAAYNKNIKAQETYRAYQLFTLSGISNVLPNNAFIENQNKATSPGPGPSGAMSAGGFSSLIVGLSSQSLGSVLASQVFSSILNNQGITQQIALFAASALTQASILSALPSLATLAQNSDIIAQGTSSPAVNTALATNNLNAITGLVQSGAIEKQLTDILTQFGVPTADIANILQPLTAAVTIGLLQFGLFSAANSLKIPGLLLQVLGNISDPEIQQLLVSAAGRNFGDVLNDPVSVLALKANLTAQLVAKGTSEDTAQAQVQQAIDATVAQSKTILTDAQLQDAIVKNLEAAQVSNDDALALADQASTQVQTDLLVQDINTAFTADSLAATSLSRSQQLNDAINTVLENNDIQTKRQLHDALVKQLQTEGVTTNEANDQANQVLLDSQSTALKNSFAADRVNQNLLIASLNSASNTPTTGVTQTAPGPTQTTPTTDNSAAIAQAVSQTIAANPAREFQFRQLLASNLAAQGIANADILAFKSAIAVQGNNPLTSSTPGGFLSPDQLANNLVVTLSKSIASSTNSNPALASDLAKGFVLSAIGPTAPGTLVSDEVRAPNSALNLLVAAYQTLRKSNAAAYATARSENFTDTIKPRYEQFMIADRINDPGTQLYMAALSIFNPKFGRQKGYIDIPA